MTPADPAADSARDAPGSRLTYQAVTAALLESSGLAPGRAAAVPGRPRSRSRGDALREEVIPMTNTTSAKSLETKKLSTENETAPQVRRPVC
jgi:hypothetical protein